jgi:hypothetical protein
LIFVFLFWTIILAFAIYRSERRSTRAFLVFAMAINLVGAAVLFVNGDEDRFVSFERAWRSIEPAPHAD